MIAPAAGEERGPATVTTFSDGVQFPPWQPVPSSSATVIAPAAALDVELRLRSIHGCTIGGGAGGWTTTGTWSR